MKKYAIILFLLVLFFPLFLTGCERGEEKLSCYTLNCVYDDGEHTLSCKQTLDYYNNTDNVLTMLEFFLYPNSFQKCAVPTSSETLAYPNGIDYGKIEIESVSASNTAMEFNIKNDAILVVTLLQELFPAEMVEIDIEYCVYLANTNNRLGYGSSTVNFGNFYPIACVYEDGFVENDFAKNGDPFYSDISNYDVSITFDEKFQIASSGVVKYIETDSGNKIAHISGQKLRDFCFVLSENFKVESAEAGDITVNYYYVNDAYYKENLQLAVKVVEEFEEMFGKYPYKTLNVVQCDFCFGGMEYPNLVYIADHITDNTTYQYVIVHEIAHQWWYSLVGNDEYREAWVDESLTEYSVMLFYEMHSEYGYNYDTLIENAKKSYLLFVEVYRNVQGDVDQSMNRALCDYATEPEYVNCIYTKGVLMYDSVRSSIGDNRFFKCLRAYFDDFCYKNASGADLIKSFSKTAKINLEGYFTAWLDGTVVITS